MTWTWDSTDSYNRKPLRISWCGATASGLRIALGAGTQYYPKYGNPRAWLTGADMPVRWDTDASGVLPYSSSDFTGEMHAYAQVLMTHPRALDLFAPGGSGFRADWAYTHGLYLQTLTDGSLRPWCIAVSAAGVFARILPHCKVAAGYTAPAKPADPPGDATPEEIQQWEDDSKKWDAEKYKELHGYYPLAPANTWFDTAGWTQLADAAAVAAFYALSPFYERCGWAFDSTGVHAVNTGYEYIDTGSSHGYRCSEYVITITPDADGAPASASISLNNSGYARYVWNGSSAAPARLVVPGAGENAGILQKFDLALNDTVKTVLGGDGDIAPLISWYDNADQLTGAVHVNSVTSINEDIDGSGEYGPYDALPVGGYSYDVGHRTAGTEGGAYFRGASPVPFETQTGDTYTYNLLPAMRCLVDTGSYIYREENIFRAEYQHVTMDGEGKNINGLSAIIIPIGARCAAYMYNYTSESITTTEQDRYEAWVWAPEGNDPANNPSQRARLKGHNRYYYCDGSLTCDGSETGFWDFDIGWSNLSPGTWCKQSVPDNSHINASHWFADSDGHALGLYCVNTDGTYGAIWGFCGNEGIPAPSLSGLVYGSGTNTTQTRTEKLYFRDGTLGIDAEVFSNVETGPTFTTVLTPLEGNKYAFKEWNGQRMYCWSDPITDQIVYSTAYNADSGPGFAYITTLSYPIDTLSASSMHSWVGVPGNFSI